MISTQLGSHCRRWPSVAGYVVVDWNHVVPARSPYSRMHIYRPVWSLEISTWMIQRKVWRKCCGQMKLKLSLLESTRLTVFARQKAYLDPENTIPINNYSGRNLLYGCFSDNGTELPHPVKRKLDEAKYREILSGKPFVSTSTLKMGDPVFRHGNDPKHTVKEKKGSGLRSSSFS